MELVRELIKLGVSKYRIAKELNINWRTVHNWSKGSKPNPKNMEALENMVKKLEV